MKRIIFTFSTIGCLMFTLITFGQQADQKYTDAKENLNAAKSDVKEAKENLKAAKKLLAGGTSPKLVAKDLGVSVPTLYRWIPAGQLT